MIIHIDNDNPKPIEQKVQELILSKLFIKADDIEIYIDKSDFIKILLKDIMALAIAEYDIDKALKIILKQKSDQEINPALKKIELSEYTDTFSTEIDAYSLYINLAGEETDDLQIYDQVRFLLNSDDELLEKKLYNLMVDSVGLKISEEVTQAAGVNRQLLLETYANYIKVIAANETIDDAADELYYKNEEFFIQHNLTSDFIKGELANMPPELQEEINSYKFALSLVDQGADIAMILATVKQLLQLP